ncbi:MoaD/ThiS family protein [Chloroflexota bacterium]
MSKVRLEVLPSLAETLGIEDTSDEAISELEDDGVRSVRELLNRLCVRYKRFGQMVFDVDTQELTGRVVIFFNGRSLELVNGLETRLSDGDTLTLVPLIEGG